MSFYMSAVAGAGSQFFDNNGNPLNRGRLRVTNAGVQTLANIFASPDGRIQMNPVRMDSAGRSDPIWFGDGNAYDIYLEAPDGTVLQAFLSVSGVNSHRQIDGVIDVRDFGAKGNGITDDTAAIQRAINSINNDYGKTIEFNGGVFPISSRLEVNNKKNLTFSGGGATIKATTTKAYQGGGDIFYVHNNCENVVINDFIIDGSKASRSSVVPYGKYNSAITIVGNSRTRLVNIVFINHKIPCVNYQGNMFFLNDIYINNCDKGFFTSIDASSVVINHVMAESTRGYFAKIGTTTLADASFNGINNLTISNVTWGDVFIRADYPSGDHSDKGKNVNIVVQNCNIDMGGLGNQAEGNVIRMEKSSVAFTNVSISNVPAGQNFTAFFDRQYSTHFNDCSFIKCKNASGVIFDNTTGSSAFFRTNGTIVHDCTGNAIESKSRMAISSFDNIQRCNSGVNTHDYGLVIGSYGEGLNSALVNDVNGGGAMGFNHYINIKNRINIPYYANGSNTRIGFNSYASTTADTTDVAFRITGKALAMVGNTSLSRARGGSQVSDYASSDKGVTIPNSVAAKDAGYI